MDHSTHVHLTESELTDAVLSDAPIYGPDDYSIGSVSAVHGTGLAAHAVIDVGSFLGIGAKPVAVSVRDLSFMRDEDGNVHGHTSWTKDQLKELPEHEHNDVTQDYDDETMPPLPLIPIIL